MYGSRRRHPAAAHGLADLVGRGVDSVTVREIGFVARVVAGHAAAGEDRVDIALGVGLGGDGIGRQVLHVVATGEGDDAGKDGSAQDRGTEKVWIHAFSFGCAMAATSQ